MSEVNQCDGCRAGKRLENGNHVMKEGPFRDLMGCQKSKYATGDCTACGEQLLPSNVLVDDGCPCNSPRGVNFKPMPCSLCRTENCVKPGHRVASPVRIGGTELAKHPAVPCDCGALLLPVPTANPIFARIGKIEHTAKHCGVAGNDYGDLSHPNLIVTGARPK